MNVAILCGGEGKRMGGINKGLLKVCGKYFVQIIAQELSALGEVVVVGKSRDFEGMMEALEDSDPGLGPLGGIYTALKHFEEDVLVVPCDMPHFKFDHAKFLLDLWESHDFDSISIYTNSLTPIPGIYSYGLLETIEKRLRERRLSLRRLVLESRSLIVHTPFFEDLFSVNSWEDFEGVKEVLCL